MRDVEIKIQNKITLAVYLDHVMYLFVCIYVPIALHPECGEQTSEARFINYIFGFHILLSFILEILIILKIV